MVEVRTCVFLFAVLLHIQVAIGKPFFGLMYCEMFCDDDDDVTTTTTTTDSDYDDELWCYFCPGPRRPAATTPNPATTWRPGTPGPGLPPPPFNFNIPPNGNGMSLSLQPGPNGQWNLNWLPGQWGSSGSPPVAITPTTRPTTTVRPGSPTTPAGVIFTTIAPTTVAPAAG